MHCDVKKFQYSGKEVSSICLVDITAGIYGTTMTFNFPGDKKTDIVESLSEAKIPLKSVGLTSISIQTPIYETANIKKTLEVLARDGFISQDFVQEIATNYPNGVGGKMDLNNPVIRNKRPFNVSIFNLNAQLKKELRKDKQEDTYCGFKPGFLIGKSF